MAASKINGFTVAYAALGGIILWSGIKGETLSDTFKDLISGQPPTTNEQEIGTPTLGINDSDSNSNSNSDNSNSNSTANLPSGTAAENQAIAKVLAAPYGWSTGTEWTDLVNLWNQESGWSNTAQNASSGAYGIPQALPYTKMPKAAWPPADGGSASATSQISWGLSYIKSTYGSPEAAWAHEESDGWY